MAISIVLGMIEVLTHFTQMGDGKDGIEHFSLFAMMVTFKFMFHTELAQCGKKGS
jgi:hypothetical protein